MKKHTFFACLLSLAAAPAMAEGGTASTSGSYQSDQSSGGSAMSDQSSTMGNEGGGMAQGGGMTQGGGQQMTFEQLDSDSDGMLSPDEASAAGIISESGAAGGGAAGGSMGSDTGTEDTTDQPDADEDAWEGTNRGHN